MSWFEVVGVLLAGVAAGTINAVVGSGTLLTFPTLLAFGLPPVTASVSNTIGLAPGSISGAWGYRRELAGQRPRLIRLGIGSALGALVGVGLLLRLPSSAFETIVPVLVGLGVVLVITGPLISKRVANRRPAAGHTGGPVLWTLVFGTGMYGGYFAAAQGVLLTAFLGIALDETLQRVNAAKNVLVSTVNVVAAIAYTFLAPVSWVHVGLLALGSVVGGQLGARVGRRLPAYVLRGVIAVVGIAAIISLLR